METYDIYKEIELSNGVKLKDFQNKLLEILKYFIHVCEENNLRYWCGGGTMLGAVRHKGFIPWDDDIDVFMPRRDYNKLYEIWESVADTHRYVLCKTDKYNNYHHTAMNLVDINTTYISKNTVNEDIIHGIYIDVIPFEGCPNGLFDRIFQIINSILFSVYNVQRLPDNQGRLLKIPTSVLLNIVNDKELRYKIWSTCETNMTKYDFDKSRYVKETVTSFKGLFRKYLRTDFDTIDMVFEDIVVKIPRGFDNYMKRIYGDYMNAIAPELRTVRYNTIEFIDLNNSYKIYKGKHYLKNN